MTSVRPTLIYSGGCRFCRWVVRNIIPLVDPYGWMDLIPNRSHWADYRIPYTTPARFANWWFQNHYGHVSRSESGAAWELLREFRRTRWIATLFSYQSLDKIDKWVKEHRPMLAGWVSDGPARLRLNGQEISYDWKLDDVD